MFSKKKAKDETQEFATEIHFPLKEREQFSNAVITSHYKWYSFFFVNLFEQFHRLANIFFLFCSILQAIPVISPLNPVMGFLSLGFMLLISMVKAGYEDFLRHKADKEVNEKECTILGPNGYEQSTWQDLNPGDIVFVQIDQEFPADCIILETESKDNKCRIETAALDGETNLKFKNSVSQNDIKHKSFDIEISPPTAELSVFNGNINVEGEIINLNLDCFVPRSCVLRKTRGVQALVVYTGKHTKVIMGSSKPRFKYTEIDRFISHFVLFVFIFILVVSVIFDICSFFWTQRHKTDGYLHIDIQPNIYYLWNVFSWLLVINTLIPLCVYPSLDLVRFFLSLNITNDVQMMDEDRPSRCRNSDLVSTIGRVTHIFSDKTGTLTKNRMTFTTAAFENKIFGEVDMSNVTPPEYIVPMMGHPECMVSMNPKDIESYREKVETDQDLKDYMMAIVLCHSAVCALNDTFYNPQLIKQSFPSFEMSYEVPLPEMVAAYPYLVSYQTSSPDELALLHFARECGYVLYNVDEECVQVLIKGELHKYPRPVVFDFTSKRKRQSVLAQVDGKWRFYMKGADSTVFSRSRNVSPNIKSRVDGLSLIGLRTLCYAVKDADETGPLIERYNEIKSMPIGMEEVMEEFQEDYEVGFHCFGVSGVMDELQDEVKLTLTRLRNANIKTWMLTGDKLDTALNIASNSGLKHATHNVVVLTTPGHYENVQNVNFNKTLLAIEGQNMNAFFADPMFWEIAHKCTAVVCARCEPKQKGNAVREFKKMFNKSIVLGIGDGANDVDMIRAADVGIGVEGREGSEAVMSSDFSIPSFKHIARLLIAHGRWCVNRTSLLILMTFYKTTMIAFMQLLFGMFNGFSATSAFDSGFLSLYNTVLTIPQLFFICIFEVDVDEKFVLAVPQVYHESQKDGGLGYSSFLWMYIHALVHSCLIFFFSYFESNIVLLSKSAVTFDLSIFTQITGWTILIVFTVELILNFKTITIVHILLYIGCIVIYILIELIYSFMDEMLNNILGIVFVVPRIWFMIPFVAGTCIIIDMIALFIKPYLFPSISLSVAELEYSAKMEYKR